MTLLTRIGRLFRADLDAVLDGLEDPAAVLRQALADMDDALARELAQAARLAHDAALLEQAMDTAGAQVVRAAEDVTLCLDAAREDLARASLRRRLEAEARVAALTRQDERLAAERATLEQRVTVLRERLAALRARAALLPLEADASTQDKVAREATPTAIGEAEVELALLAEQQRRARA